MWRPSRSDWRRSSTAGRARGTAWNLMHEQRRLSDETIPDRRLGRRGQCVPAAVPHRRSGQIRSGPAGGRARHHPWPAFLRPASLPRRHGTNRLRDEGTFVGHQRSARRFSSDTAQSTDPIADPEDGRADSRQCGPVTGRRQHGLPSPRPLTIPPSCGNRRMGKEREWRGRPIRDIAGVRGGSSGRPLAYGKEP